MVSRDKLKSELHSFNENLDKHMKSIDFENMSEKLDSAGSSQSDNAKENVVLLSENLKDIRYEINMMRKNLSSDVSTMVSKEMETLKNQFFDELLSAQKQVHEHVKSIDLTPVKEVADEVEDIKKKQVELDKRLSELSDDFSKKLVSMNTHEEERQDNFIEEVKTSHSTLLKKIHGLDNSIVQIDKTLGNISREISNSKEETDQKITQVNKKLQNKVNVLAQETKNLSQQQQQLNHFKEAITQDRNEISEASSHNEEANSIQEESVEPIINNNEDVPTERILSIDEKLKKLEELR